MRRRSRQSSGFTLIELAIVLVIIGLIVGGVLVGQDLIRAATIRSVVTDIEKINAAATTFRGKYSGLPGDILNKKAVDYGLNTALNDGNRNGNDGLGDANGVIEACGSGANGFGCETALFWSDLTFASLIPVAYGSYNSTLTAVTTNTLSTYVPKTRLRDAALVTVFNNNGRNYLAIGAVNNAGVAAAGSAGAITYVTDSSSARVTPLEARNIDEKLDDGAALTGMAYAIASGTNPTTLATAAASADNTCVLTGGSYMVDTDVHASNFACSIAIRTSF